MSAINNFALIIGGMKCGTTSLYNHLVQHPQVAGSSEKEPNFFASDENWTKGVDWYQALWDWNPTTHKVALEASTDYTKRPTFPNAAERIAGVDAQFKFIYILRNPINRIESHYNHGQTGRKQNQPIEKSLGYMINVSRYAMQLKPYYDYFSPENILILDFDDLKRDPLPLVQNVCQFLRIESDYDFAGLNKVYNRYQPRQKNHPVWEYLRNIMPLKAMTKAIPHGPKSAARRLLAPKPPARFVLSAEQRTFILQELKEDMEELSSNYGFDVSSWNLPESGLALRRPLA